MNNRPTITSNSSSDAIVVAIPVKKMRDIADRYPELYKIAIREISFRFRLLMEWTTESVLLKNEFRVAKLLLLVSRLNGMPNELNPIFYTQDKLAHLSTLYPSNTQPLSPTIGERRHD